MKRAGKPVIFIVAILIGVFAYLSFFGANNYYGDNRLVFIKGASDIRWGIDIKGGVQAVFSPSIDKSKITADQMVDAQTIIQTRLVNQNITDSEVYNDTINKDIIVQFPWQSGQTDFDPTKAVEELGNTAMLTFRLGTDASGAIILQGSSDIKSTSVGTDGSGNPCVNLALTSSGKAKFATATTNNVGKQISIWMDKNVISSPKVNGAILDGNAQITGNFTADAAKKLSDQINAGSLPFSLSVDNSSLQIISPTLGSAALDSMLLAGIIAFILICIMMIWRFRLPGIIACIALVGHIAGVFAFTSGFFTFIPSFTMTIPGLAGMILSIGMGVDANVITTARIEEELALGKTLDGAIDAGYDDGFPAIFDGNITVGIIAIILMGIFGPPGSLFAKILHVFTFMFKSTITGLVYSFGYTLLMGIVFNFIMGVGASRGMLKSISRYKKFRNPALYTGLSKERRGF